MTVTAPPRTPSAPPAVAQPSRGGLWVGTGALLRLALRRDRVLLPAWVLGFSFMVVFSVAATKNLYAGEQSLRDAADAINATAALVALYGKVYDPTSLGAVSLIKMTAFGAAMVSILFVFLVVRHSRAEEESGRLELVSSGVVGRAAPLTAALLLGWTGSLALGLLTAVGLAAGGLPWAGSFAFGLGWALTGVVFSAIAGVAAQLTTSGRAAIGLGMAAVGTAYLLRAVGDLAAGDPGFLSWLSPIGWSQQIRAFAGDRWAVMLLPVVATLVLVPTAYALRSRRDLGSGFVPDRAGPATGQLGGGLSLSWRLQRGLLVAWVVAAGVMGLVLGSIAHNVTGFFDSPQMQKYLELLGGKQGLTDAFLAAEVGIFGALVSGYAIAATSRLRHEEAAGRAEPLLSTSLTRTRWAAGHYAVALGGTFAILLVTGAAAGLGHGIAVDEVGRQLLRLAGAGVAQVPAAWVMAGIVLVLFGWAPRLVPGAWALLAAFVVFGEFGSLWELPTWVLDLSPFAHSPTLPGQPVDWSEVVLLLVVGAALSVLGLVGWRRRDLAA